MILLSLISFVILVFSGIPIVFALGVSAALVLALTTEIPMVVVAQRLWGGLDSFPIMAIPFFVLAGLLMERGGIARRIVDLASALVGWITGSLFMVAIVTGTGLAAISGSGSADTAAIGSIMFPEMRKRSYDLDLSAALVASAGALASIIPPSIIMIVIGVTSNVSIGALFLGGVVPGILIVVCLLVVSWRYASKRGGQYLAAEAFSFSGLGRVFWSAIPALILPVVIVGGIVGGIFTATEASCVAVIAAFSISTFIYRELKFSDLPDLLLRAASLSSAVLIIIASASIFSWLIASQGAAQALSAWLQGVTQSAVVFLALVNVGLLVVGMFLESVSAIVLLMPVLMPIAQSYGIDPVHFGVVVALNLSIGLVTPPYGICLFVASMVARRSITQVSSQAWRPLIVMISVLVLSTYYPPLVMSLGNAVLGAR